MADLTDAVHSYLLDSDDDMQDIAITDVLLVTRGVRMSNGSRVIITSTSNLDEITCRGMVAYLNDWAVERYCE